MFKLAVNGMCSAVETVLERQGLTTDDVRVLIPHQANKRIMDAIAQRLGLPQERVAVCIGEYGNTSSATIPLALHKWVHSQGIERGELVVLCAFASGLLWGSALVRW